MFNDILIDLYQYGFDSEITLKKMNLVWEVYDTNTNKKIFEIGARDEQTMLKEIVKQFFFIKKFELKENL